jgi:hypothetical protein
VHLRLIHAAFPLAKKHQCLSVGDVGHFRPERRRFRSPTCTEATQKSPRRRLSAINAFLLRKDSERLLQKRLSATGARPTGPFFKIAAHSLVFKGMSQW